MRKWFISDRLSLPPTVGISVGVMLILLQLVVSFEILNPESESSETRRNITALERLHTQLFTNYDKNIVPFSKGVPTDIDIKLRVVNIDIDEMNGRMTLHGFLLLKWTDENRSWNPTEYDNIKRILSLPSHIWKPNITLLNGAGTGNTHIAESLVKVKNNGLIIWSPTAVFIVNCNFNLASWPFDTQTCDLKIGTWPMKNIKSPSKHNQVYLGRYANLCKWKIIGNKTSLRTKDHYTFTEFAFALKRYSSVYTAVIYTPAFCVVLLLLSIFWLPPQMGDKILLNGIVIAVIAAFLLYFGQLLPILAENTPLVVLFYSSCLLLVSISTIIAVVVLYLPKARHERRIPDFLKNLLNGRFGKILCLSQYSLESDSNSFLNDGTKELGEHVYDNSDNENPDRLNINPVASPMARSIQLEWILLATAVDRICFLCFCIIFICLAIKCSV